MDAPKELNVNLYGDKFLERGFAVLAFDGPGQGEAPIRGNKFTPTAWIDAGAALVEWCRARPEVDDERIVGFGLSFGSYWMSQIAATQPSLRGSAVGLVLSPLPRAPPRTRTRTARRRFRPCRIMTG
jgi:alpha-beta hydrolase superfamily lysophospholipase